MGWPPEWVFEESDFKKLFSAPKFVVMLIFILRAATRALSVDLLQIYVDYMESWNGSFVICKTLNRISGWGQWVVSLKKRFVISANKFQNILSHAHALKCLLQWVFTNTLSFRVHYWSLLKLLHLWKYFEWTKYFKDLTLQFWHASGSSKETWDIFGRNLY